MAAHFPIRAVEAHELDAFRRTNEHAFLDGPPTGLSTETECHPSGRAGSRLRTRIRSRSSISIWLPRRPCSPSLARVRASTSAKSAVITMVATMAGPAQVCWVANS